MTEVTQQPILQELDHTPVREISEPEPLRKSEDNEDSSINQQPHKLKRKKRKHRKVKPQRDPEEIKELRLQRLNMQREGQWNNRFVNETIPQMFINKARKRKSEQVRRTKSPIQTVYLDKDLPHSKLPHILKINGKEEISKNTQKSFNIRTVGGKREPFRKARKLNLKSQQHTVQSLESKLPIKVEQLHIDKVLTKPKESAQQKLKAKLQEKTKIHAINPQYKVLLQDLIHSYSLKPSKQLRTMLQNQISSIGNQKNPYVRIENLIKERKQLLKGISETDQKTTLGAYLGLQLASVALLEEILKFKAKWEEQYFKMGINKKIEYSYQGSNYLLAMNQEVQELSPDEPDPFLVARTSRLQELVGSALKEEEQRQRKQMMLKIRACELLLIEEELSS